MAKVRFLKTKDFEVISPKGNTGFDAGIDLFCPPYSEGFKTIFELENPTKKIEKDEKGYFISIPAHGDVNINSGLYTRFPNNIALIAFNKSGVATKQKLICGACVDDSSYEGLLHLHMINTSDEVQKIYLGNKVVQWVPVKIAKGFEVLEENVTEKDKFFKGHKSARKAGGFGSTGLKS